ncbi:hypothetical protein F5146DRAFT_1206568 [Armillaria mellea]|nr:hypothetical protein F5146DRAFT_1206568 [Armillaria mellea]
MSSTAGIFIILSYAFIAVSIIDIAVANVQQKRSLPLVHTYLPWIGLELHYMAPASHSSVIAGPMKSVIIVSSRRMMKWLFIDKHFNHKDAYFCTLSALGSRLDRA